MNFRRRSDFFTTKDLARWIAWDDTEASFQKAHRQIRHWTENDLLRTENEKNTGKGIPRFYRIEPTFQIAAILMELCRYIQSIEILRCVSEAFYEDSDEGGENSFYLGNSLTDLNVYAQVSWEGDANTGSISKANFKLWDDLEGEFGQFFDPSVSSSVIINLTNVMDRVFYNKNIEDPKAFRIIYGREVDDE